MFQNYSDVVSVDELQSMLGIGRNTAYGLLRSNTINSVRIGRKFIIPKMNIINYLKCS